MPRCGRRALGLVAAILLTAGARAADAQDTSCGAPGDVEVVKLTFTGNEVIPTSVLADGIVTDQSTWFRRNMRWAGGFWGTKRCLDRQAFPLDRIRLVLLYHNHGYASVTVDTIVTPAGTGQVEVRFSIHEGEPMIVDSLSITGLDSVPEREAIIAHLPQRLGKPYDTYAIDTTRDVLTLRLHNGGYPDAEVLIDRDAYPATRKANITFKVTTGRRMTFGDISLKVSPRQGVPRHVTDRAIEQVAALNSGDLYSQQELQRAQRALYQTQAFATVRITPDSTRTPGQTTVPVSLALAEGYMHETKAGFGYGTLDCFRTTLSHTAYSLNGGASQLTLRGQLSKIGVGNPFTGPALCPIARTDLYSKDLNYLTGATITQPAIFKGIVPSFSLYSERRSEFDAYLRTTPVGGNMTFSRPMGRTIEAFSYSVEYGRTEAQPALLCAVFNACEPVDRESVQRLQRLAVASVSITNDASDNPVTPTRGTVLRAEFRTAGAYTGSDPSLHFNKILVDGSLYIPLGTDVVLAARLRLGAVLGSSFNFTNSSEFIPQQERLFAGGQTTVRGYAQNVLGPAVYIPTVYDTVGTSGAHSSAPLIAGDTVYFRANANIGAQRTIPTGGNALAVGMLEARIKSPIFTDVLQWALFLDAGSVWNVGQTTESTGAGSLKLTPGFGVRVKTQIGVLRVDFAYNPYQQPTGAAYFDAPVKLGGALLCVSPTNTLPVIVGTGGVLQSQGTGTCPSSYQPPLQTTWWRRFAFVLTLGEAF